MSIRPDFSVNFLIQPPRHISLLMILLRVLGRSQVHNHIINSENIVSGCISSTDCTPLKSLGPLTVTGAVVEGAPACERCMEQQDL